MSARPARRWQWVGFGAGSAAFALLLADQWLRGPVLRSDPALLDAVTPWHERGWPVHAVGEALSWPGSIAGTLFLTFVAAMGWWLRGARAAAGWAVGGGLAAAVAVTIVKLLVQREPPPLGIALGTSFPSGHTVGAAANLGLLLMFQAQVLVDRHGWRGRPARRAWRMAVAAWAVTAVAGAADRLLAQAHWASAVLSGLALGLVVACATLLAARVPHPPLPSVKPRAGQG